MEYLAFDSEMTSLADALRSKKHLYGPLAFPSAFHKAVQIETLPNYYSYRDFIYISVPYYSATGKATSAFLASSTTTFNFSDYLSEPEISRIDLNTVQALDTNSFDAVKASANNLYTFTVNAYKFIQANSSYYSSSYRVAIGYYGRSEYDPYTISKSDGYCQWYMSVDNYDAAKRSIYVSCAEPTYAIPEIGTSSLYWKSYSFTNAFLLNTQRIGEYAFENNQTLQNVYGDYVEEVGNYAFHSCASLKNAAFPICTRIGSSAFFGCALSSVNFPNCISVDNYAFAYCSTSNVYMPTVQTIGEYAFASCEGLASVDIRNCTSIGSYAFYSCDSFSIISFNCCSYIGSHAFDGCTGLKSIYVKTISVPFLGAVALPIGVLLGSCSIYVLPSMVEAFKSDIEWGIYSNNIFPDYN